MLIAAVVLIVVAVGISISFALAKANPKDFNDAIERGEAEARLAELEGPEAHSSSSGETVCPPVRTEPSHSEGGRGDSRRSVAHGPSSLDLPRLGE